MPTCLCSSNTKSLQRSTAIKSLEWLLTITFPDQNTWLHYIKLLPKRYIRFQELNTFWTSTPENTFPFSQLSQQKLDYNKGVLMQNIMSGKAPLTLIAKFPLSESRHTSKFNVPIRRMDLFKSSLVYSGGVLWNSHPGSLGVPVSTTTFKSRYSAFLMNSFNCAAMFVS